MVVSFFFFFQAEDGIRDVAVTGVQTCALPIYGRALDRRLLVDLEKPVWDSVAGALQARLPDSVIDAAVRRVAPQDYSRDGGRPSPPPQRRRGLPPVGPGPVFALPAGLRSPPGPRRAPR